MTNVLILIIEGNEVNRVLVRDMLRFKVYQTIETQTAEEGIWPSLSMSSSSSARSNRH